MSIIIIIHHCRLKVTSRPYSIKPTTEIYTTHGSLDIRIDRERRWAHEVHNYESVFTEPATPLWPLTNKVCNYADLSLRDSRSSVHGRTPT